ncbi:MAG: DUF1700 domain-containing protein [Bacilli bacterium]|nr:DUF1700 domain-containing protein [Bacilli bacterium]
MNKNEFVLKLKEALKGKFSDSEIAEAVSYYEELILEGIDSGKTEEEIVSGFGEINKIVAKITTDIVDNRENSKNIKGSWKSFVAIVAVCTSPVLIILAIAFTAIVIGLFIGFIGMVIGIFSSMIVALVATVPLIIELFSGTLGLGDGFIVIGIFIFALSLLGALVIWVYNLSVFLFNKITKLFSKVIKKKVEVKTNA